MSNPLCLSPLKFYDSVEKQERFKVYAFGHISPVITPSNVIPPFQVVIPGISALNEAKLVALDNNAVIDVTDNIQSSMFMQDNVLQYIGNFSINPVKFEGLYYLELTVDTIKYYSEVICFTNNLDGYIKLEYWNPESDFILKNGKITFANNFHFIVYLKTELGKPEYSFEEEAQNRFGYNFIESQVSKKTYKFNAVLPEYYCDALRLVRLCSHKIITCNNEDYEALTFEMSVDWQEQGDLASVDFEFDIDNIIVNLGGFEYASPTEDFNKGYNADFLSDSL